MTQIFRRVTFLFCAAGGFALLSTPAFAQTCRDRVEMLERELAVTKQQLYHTQEQLRRAQQQPSPSYRPYGGSGYGHGYGSPLGQANRTLQEMEHLRQHWDRLAR